MKLFLLLLIGLLSINVTANELDDIINQHAEAMGGKENWLSLKSYRQIYAKDNGLALTITCEMPHKISIHFQKDQLEVSKVYDGEHGYIIKNGTYVPMRPGETIEMAEEPHYYSDLLLAKELEYQLEYLGEESIDAIKCHKLRLIKSETDEQTYWINVQTNLIEQTGEYSEDPAHAGIYYKTQLSDYRNVNGLMFPFKQALIANDESPKYSFLEKVEVNFTIDKNAFQFKPKTVKDLIAYWQDRYKDIGLDAFTFEQETIQYRDGKTPDTVIWQEAVQYPESFRIDFGPKEDGNYNLYKGDSLFAVRKGAFVVSRLNIQTSVLWEGRLYDLSVESMLEKLRLVNINTELFSEGIYRGRPAYIIGALPGDETSDQIWLDAERRIILRKISQLNDERILDSQYDDFLDFNGSWIESWVEFYIDGKLMQTERYKNIKINPELTPGVFDPQNFQNYFWY